MRRLEVEQAGAERPEMRSQNFGGRIGGNTGRQARRPRARLVTSHSGGSGTPPGRHYDRSAGSLLDWDWAQALVPGSAAPS
jgi:hypothetical protein